MVNMLLLAKFSDRYSHMAEADGKANVCNRHGH